MYKCDYNIPIENAKGEYIMKRSLFIVVVCIILCLSLPGCIEATPSSPASANQQTTGEPMPTDPTSGDQTKPTAKPTDPEPTVPMPSEPAIPVLAPTFTNMPQVVCDYAEVFMAEHIAIFTFITPGMNDAVTTVVTYDLLTDTLLGQLDLGEGNLSVFPLKEDRFAVLDLNHTIYRIYDSSCNLLQESVLSGVQSPFGFAGHKDNVLILSQLIDGRVFVYDLNTDSAILTDLEPTAYQYIGSAGDSFLVSSLSMELLRIDMDGTCEELYDQGNAHVVSDNYFAGVQGDYITLLPLQGSDAVMVPSAIYGEMFLDSHGTGLLSRSQHYDKDDVVQYYDTASMTVRQAPVNGMVVNAGLWEDQAVVITREDFGVQLKFEYVDFSKYDAQSIHSLAYDAGILNGRVPLPEPTGSDEMLALIQYYQNEYGVRILYEPDIFDLDYVGYTLYPCTEQEAYQKALLLEKLFQFLPKGLFHEMAERLPVVIYLCENIQPAAGGMHTVMDGYSVLFLSVTGNDEYFMNVAGHEMGHALDLTMEQEVLSGWQALMPADVVEAAQDLSLTVEYTPDDKGRTPVWFVDVYSRFTEREDRAVLFSYLFDAWISEDYSILQYEGLRIKANYWAEMLRLTYESCKDVVFPWENVQ